MILNSNDLKKVEIKEWPFLIKSPTGTAKPKRLLLLLHGHLGNEESMWPLTSTLPDAYFILAPRAPKWMGPGQFSWHEITPQWPGLNMYQHLSDELISRVHTFANENNLSLNDIDVIGFSQGAVMVYALTILYPELIGKAAALAGFLPQTWMHYLESISFHNRKFFISHGIKDDIVPVNKAHQTAEWLREHGAQVLFCESNTGHKINNDCMKKMGKFFL